ncbi:MAG: protease complex subunit PrcB family protein [Rubrobacter sp.]|nr:protease complex subunit PrcB family protein [Rubrobacter sp.]
MRENLTHHGRSSGRVFSAFVFSVFLAAAFVLASCAGGGGSNPQTQPETTPEATAEATEEERMLEATQIDSGSLGQGGAEPRAVVASSPETISAATGIQSLRDAESTTASGGEKVYVAVLWGEKNTGGYAVEIEGASLEGERVEIFLALQSPPEGAIVSQALTYPYAVAALGGLDPANKDFVLTDQSGRELEWPVETA